jgi:cell wall-associated NlpC family hydrolase
MGDNDARTYELRTAGHLAGPFSHGAKALVTISDPLGRRRAFYGAGYDLMLFRPSKGLGAYGIAGMALGLATDTTPQKLAALWSVGAGLEWRPLGFASLSAEARYRVLDRGPHGFWSTRGQRSGMSWALGASFSWNKSAGAVPEHRSGSPATTTRPGGGIAPPVLASSSAMEVVRVAIDAIGTPYRWGGTAENGFDCSGLMQWAYGQQGVSLPRMSRDQALVGTAITPTVDALAPGDILLFAANPGAGVTHVGMYVGERKFIHSGSSGVRISLLDYSDTNGAYWLARWVGARRIVP